MSIPYSVLPFFLFRLLPFKIRASQIWHRPKRGVIFSTPVSSASMFSATVIYLIISIDRVILFQYHQLTSSKSLTPAHGNDA